LALSPAVGIAPRRMWKEMTRLLVVLMGFMGAGKTTIGYLLAEKLGLPFVDIDILIEHRTRRRVVDIFADDGEEYFRRLEHETIVETLSGPAAVVALGGGAVEHPATRVALEAVMGVHLEVSYEEAMLRIGKDSLRPMMRRPDIGDIYKRRLPIYEGAAKLAVRTDTLRPEEIVLDLLGHLVAPRSVPPGSRSVLVAPMGGAHQVHIGAAIASELDSLLPRASSIGRCFVVSAGGDRAPADALVARLGDLAGYEPSRFDVPVGESANHFAVVEQLSTWLAASEARRDDLLIGVGGEDVCYLTGFVASTYNRGMPLALVPTTLHGQADAAIGGKNGIRLSEGGNLSGTIHQPVVVVSDVELSAQRRGYGYRTGLAEMAKHAIIADPALLDALEEQAELVVRGDLEVLVDLLARSTAVKAAIVTADQREQGERIQLNYGHTFGRAFERLLPPGPDRHGDSVALGMVAAGYLAARLDRIDRSVVEVHRRVLGRLGLSTRLSVSPEEMDDAWRRSRRAASEPRFVLLNGAGVAEGRLTADRDQLAGALADLAAG